MGNEARELLEMAGKKTAFDPSYTGACVTKWGKMLQAVDKKDPIQNPRNRMITAVLLENQMGHMKSLQEDTTTANAGYFQKQVFPILRRVFPNLIANQIVSVQPLTAPYGGVAFYEKRYDNAKGSKITQAGVTGLPTAMAYTGKVAEGDNMVQNFSKYYSSEFVDYDAVCSDTGTTPSVLTYASSLCNTTQWGPIRDNGTSGQRTFTVKAYYAMRNADNANATVQVIATMNASGHLIDNTANLNDVGTFDITNGHWSITPKGTSGSASTFVSNTVVYFQYYVNWELVYQTSGAAIPSISLHLTMYPVIPEKRPLKAEWTAEAMEDLKALYGLDAETELVSTFSNEVMLETDRSILAELIAGAAHVATYTYADTCPGEIEKIRSLLTMISAMSARIHKTSMRAPANFIVVGPAVQSLLDQLSTHGDYAAIEQDVVASSYGPLTSDYGISRVGTLLHKWAVYVDPFQDETKILVGLKGNSWLDAGYAYLPYIPFEVTPSFFDPNTQTVRKGMYTRYATKMLRPEYYGVITVSGLPSVTTTL
jgi:hypothetical protein